MATQRRRARQSISQAMFGGNKMQNTGNAKADAKRHTMDDKRSFKKDRANGDKELRSNAIDSGGKIGGPRFPQVETKRGDKYRKTVDDPGKIITEKTPKLDEKARAKKTTPPAVQDRQKELDDLKKMEGIDELKKKKAKRT